MVARWMGREFAAKREVEGCFNEDFAERADCHS
jgi:hypothetical protein